MAKLKKTTGKNKSKYYRILLYGKSGIGKTPLAATAPGVVFVDSEKGMESAPVETERIEIESFKEAKKAVKQLEKDGKCKSIVIDSGSHIAKIYLKEISPEYKNKIQAYGDLYEEFMDWIEYLRNVQKHIIMICRQKHFEVDGSEKYRPSFPGKAITPEIPYEFDTVFALRNIDDFGEDAEEGGNKVIQTEPDEEYEAKNRSGLKQFEKTLNLTKLFKKMEA